MSRIASERRTQQSGAGRHVRDCNTAVQSWETNGKVCKAEVGTAQQEGRQEGKQKGDKADTVTNKKGDKKGDKRRQKGDKETKGNRRDTVTNEKGDKTGRTHLGDK